MPVPVLWFSFLCNYKILYDRMYEYVGGLEQEELRWGRGVGGGGVSAECGGVCCGKIKF